MSKISEFKLFLSSVFTYLFVSVSCNISNMPPPIKEFIGSLNPLFVAVITIFLGSFMSPIMTKLLMNIRFLRSVVMWESWIDGYWFQKTYDGEDKLYSNGIIHVIMRGRDFSDIETNGVHIRYDDSKSITTLSVTIYYNALKREYVNDFKRTEGGAEESGYASGYFRSSNIRRFSPFPDTFTGSIKMKNKVSTSFSIHARKMNMKEVRDAMREGGDNWRELHIKKINETNKDGYHLL